MKGLPGAIAFLTCIPMPARVQSPDRLGRAVGWFPVVGAGIGALVGGAAWLGAATGLPPLAAAAVGVGAGLLVTGAFHEDGLADAFDGLGAGRDRSRTLEIMRDSRLGAFGAAALVMSLLLQVSALAALVALPAGAAVAATAAAHSSSRSWAALAMALPRASPDGLAAGLDYNGRSRSLALRFLVGVAIAAALLRSDTWVLAPAGAAGGLVAWWAVRRLGGVTGDILGAVQQTTLVVTLLALSATA